MCVVCCVLCDDVFRFAVVDDDIADDAVVVVVDVMVMC